MYVPTYLEPLIVTSFPFSFSFSFLLLIFKGIPPKSPRNKGKKTPLFFSFSFLQWCYMIEGFDLQENCRKEEKRKRLVLSTTTI